MRLIDADKAVNEIAELIAYEWGYEGIEEDVKRIIDDQPTVDAVPVVRCKDCKYSEPAKYEPSHRKIVICTHPHFCTYFIKGVFKKHDSFCDFGERRDGD